MKPHWTGKTFQKINLTGHLFPWRKEEPLSVQVIGSKDWFIPLFSTEEKLRCFVQRLIQDGVVVETEYRIKKVEDQDEFLGSIFAEGLRVMVDPRFEDGKIRWTEVVYEGEEYKLMGEI
jgi:hypothetical protein